MFAPKERSKCLTMTVAKYTNILAIARPADILCYQERKCSSCIDCFTHGNSVAMIEMWVAILYQYLLLNLVPLLSTVDSKLIKLIT